MFLNLNAQKQNSQLALILFMIIMTFLWYLRATSLVRGNVKVTFQHANETNLTEIIHKL